MRLKIPGLLAALLVVTACATAPQESAETGGAGASHLDRHQGRKRI
jgi:hypothetical protein